ncbi:MAG: putative type-1 restriction enzyme specificity protein [Tenericutes bacterium ADurb.Bin024]|nr:MAG: putative type-1 restriction enzyme specificity protein [Tenericutes bacterium ADurb.Bin024]
MYSKKRINSEKLSMNNYVGVDNLLQNKLGKVESIYEPPSGNLTKFNIGDTLIGNIRPYLKKIWHSDTVGGTNGDVLVITLNKKEQINDKYLYYVLSTDNFFHYMNVNSKGAKMPRGDKSSIMEYDLPIPPLEEQERIVSILDKFSTLVNDIKEGLPAEIELRRKQYEYYRNKLLTFE